MLRPPEVAALQSSQDGVVALGDHGFIVYANPEALRLLGWDHSLIGQPIRAMVPPDLQTAQRNAYENFVTSRRITSYPKVQPALGQDGRIRPVYVNVGAFERPDGSLFLCSLLREARGEPPALDLLANQLFDKGYRLIPSRADNP